MKPFIIMIKRDNGEWIIYSEHNTYKNASGAYNEAITLNSQAGISIILFEKKCGVIYV